MTEDLYFIPLLAGAWTSLDRRAALNTAFEEISRRGTQPSNVHGYEQFVEWMHLVATARTDLDALGIAIDASTTTFREAPFCFCLFRDDRALATFALEHGEARVVDHVRPGWFRLVFETGWVLWEDVLTEPQLLWERAFPNSLLPMAADDGTAAEQPGRQVRVLGGRITIEIRPGLGAGQLVFQVPRQGEQR